MIMMRRIITIATLYCLPVLTIGLALNYSPIYQASSLLNSLYFVYFTYL